MFLLFLLNSATGRRGRSIEPKASSKKLGGDWAGSLTLHRHPRRGTIRMLRGPLAPPRAGLFFFWPCRNARVAATRTVLLVIVDQGAEAEEKMQTAFAEHVARYPEDAGRPVADFDWINWVVLPDPRKPPTVGPAL